MGYLVCLRIRNAEHGHMRARITVRSGSQVAEGKHDWMVPAVATAWMAI